MKILLSNDDGYLAFCESDFVVIPAGILLGIGSGIALVEGPLAQYVSEDVEAGFFMLAFAPSVAVLFLARILDGITGGNIIVAQAYITDITPREKRTVALGYTFAIFGLGFIFGPILGGSLAAAFGPLLIITLWRGPVHPTWRIAAMTTGFVLTVFLSWTTETPGDIAERYIPMLIALALAWVGSIKNK